MTIPGRSCSGSEMTRLQAFLALATRQDAFLVLLIASTAYGLLQGGRPERFGAVTLFVGAVTSALVIGPVGTRFYHVEPGILEIDIVVLGVFLRISVRSTRFWPLWVAALLTAEVIIHVGTVIAPSVHWKAYMNATALWSWLIQGMLVAGTFRHRRRLKRQGVDEPWKT